MAAITLEHVEKAYADGYKAVIDVSLEITDGEFMILVGPSGSGKSTLLRMIVGLEDVTGGEVRIGGQRVNDKPPRDRNLAMVFQNYALYPHLSVFENIAFPLRLRSLPEEDVRRRVAEAAATLELTDHLERKPSQLSGGQRQRVAMGRAIVREADAFLFDEPLSNLDAQLRGQMRTEIARLQQRLGVTTVYVTHDQVEAMTLGDRVAVLRRGELQQVDTPRALYTSPVNLFVAGFIGSPSMNLLPAPAFPAIPLDIPDDRGRGGRYPTRAPARRGARRPLGPGPGRRLRRRGRGGRVVGGRAVRLCPLGGAAGAHRAAQPPGGRTRPGSRPARSSWPGSIREAISSPVRRPACGSNPPTCTSSTSGTGERLTPPRLGRHVPEHQDSARE